METYRGTVFPYQLDHMGHMNVQWYVSKFDEGTWHLFAKLGITPDYIRSECRGMAAVQQNIQYKSELMAGDIVVVDSSVTDLREKVISFRHRMRRADTDEEVAICDLIAVHIDRNIRKSIAFPAFVFEAAKSLPRTQVET